MSKTLYAWANGLDHTFGHLDHTWVTDYPFTKGYPTIGHVPSGDNYWYCWGVYHETGNGGIDSHPNGGIGNQLGDVSIASKLVTPMVSPPTFPGGPGTQDGSIEYYGVDGVCHMVANQTLFATGSDTQDPLRVLEAMGVRISTFIFTDYGLNNDAWDSLKTSYAPNIRQPLDSFDEWILTLGFSPNNIAEIMKYRVELHAEMAVLRLAVPRMTAKEVLAAVGVLVLNTLKSIKDLIGWDGFKKLFPAFKLFPKLAEDAVYFIDQDQLASSMEKIQARNK